MYKNMTPCVLTFTVVVYLDDKINGSDVVFVSGILIGSNSDNNGPLSVCPFLKAKHP